LVLVEKAAHGSGVFRFWHRPTPVSFSGKPTGTYRTYILVQVLDKRVGLVCTPASPLDSSLVALFIQLEAFETVTHVVFKTFRIEW